MKSMLSPPLLATLMLAPMLAHAHEGHGLESTHWHATDVLGFIVVGILAIAAIWSQRK